MNSAPTAPPQQLDGGSLLLEHQEELLGYLTVLLRDEDEAQDVFGRVVEDVLRGWPDFRGDCAPRTWLYLITRNAALRHLARPWAAREVPLSDYPALAEVPQPMRTSTAPRYRSAERKVEFLRAKLSEVDQTLLTLRLDREMDWRDIAQVLDGGPAVSNVELTRSAARLRKRFERLKHELGALARTHGLLDDADAL